MKKVIIILALALSLIGCQEHIQNQDSKDAAVVREQQSHYAKVQPIPFYDFSMDRDTLIQIYNAKNEARVTHAVITSQGTGAVIWDCPSIGFPLPADTQLTNPLVPTRQRTLLENGRWEYLDGTVEQPEPNGLYSSKNTDATYVLCVRPDGSINPIYTEQKVTTFPFEVTVVDGRVVDAGAKSSIVIDVNSGSIGDPTSSPVPSP